MALAKSIIIAHGGQIWIHSEGSKKGSLVGFSIPLADEDGARPRGDQEMGNKQPPPAPALQFKTGSVVSMLGPGLNAGEAGTSVQVDPPTNKIPMDGTTKDDEIRASAHPPGIVDSTNAAESTIGLGVAATPVVAMNPPQSVRQCPLDLPSTKVHVLVVEDSQICRTMLKKLLGTLSCTVLEAEVRQPPFALPLR